MVLIKYFKDYIFLISILVVNIVTVFVTFRPIMDLIQKLFPNRTNSRIIITLSLGKYIFKNSVKSSDYS